MPIKYNDPYGNREYAQLKGDKRDSYFKISFSEAVFLKSDEGYTLFGQVDEYQGVIRSFKPENPIVPGLCIVPFYSQNYEVRKKDSSGNWSSEKMPPSSYERYLCQLIDDYTDDWISPGFSVKGSITHIPDAMLQGQDAGTALGTIVNNCEINKIPSTGNLPKYEVSSSGGQRKSYSGYKGVSIEDKLLFVKKELCDSIKIGTYTPEISLGELVDAFCKEHADNTNYQQIYFDLLMSLIR